MVESTPSRPYTGYASDLMRIERNMVVRRRRLLAALKENEIAPTVRSLKLFLGMMFLSDVLICVGYMFPINGCWRFHS